MNVPALKGIHYAIESGRLAAEAAFEALSRGATAVDAGRARGLRRGAPRELHLVGLQRVRNMRQAFGTGFWMGGALASVATATRGHLPPRQHADGARRRAAS